MWYKLACIAAAGALGTLARFGLSAIVYRLLGTGFAWGTLVVNGLGCFLFGLLWPLAEHRLIISNETRTIALVGFMGAFTTFSTFAFETAHLLDKGQWGLAAGNFLAQNALGIALVFAGMAIGHRL